MFDLLDGLMVMMILALVLLFPRVSPCVGCIAAAEGLTDGDPDCRKDCTAFIDYSKKVGRR